MSDDKKIEMSEEEQQAFTEGLKESAQLKDQLEGLDREYKKLAAKHPLKNSKSKYSD